MSYDDPVTDDEWKVAALCARGALLFEAAKAYGLVKGALSIDVARCEELVARARARGIGVDDYEAALAFVSEFRDEIRPGGGSA